MGVITNKVDCLGLSLFHKIHLGSTRPLIKTFMPDIQPKIHNTRVSLHYKPFTFHNKQFAQSFYPYFTKKWNNSHKTLQLERDLNEYKIKLKNLYKAPKYKFYYRGSTKQGCSLLTHLRVGRSLLNDHYFPLGLSSSPQCLCHAPSNNVSLLYIICASTNVFSLIVFYS